MKLFTFFLFFVLGCDVYNSQSNNLSNKLYNLSYLELEDKFYDYQNTNKIAESKIIAELYLKKAKLEKKKDNITEGYILIHYNEKLPNALKYIDSTESASKNLSDNRYPARIYLLKGMLYFKYDNQKLALENFINALKYARQNNNTRQIVIADLQIAILNNYIGKHLEASKIFKYYYDNPDLLGVQDIEHVKFNLADTYLDLQENDKALKLISEGLKTTFKNNDEVQYNRYLILLGEYNLNTKKYSEAIKTLERCKTYFKDNNLDTSYTMLYLGQSYAALKNTEKAVENFIRIDSIVQKTNNTFPELREVYTYIIDYYKEKRDKEKQLYFIERFLNVEKFLDSQFRYVSRELPRQYDTPKLIKEKENIIKELEAKKYLSYSTIGILGLISLLLIMLFYNSRRAEKKHKKIAQDLISSISSTQSIISNDNERIIETTIENPIKLEKTITKNISEDIVQNILKELEKFEARESFLKKGITLVGLAKEIKTNSTYLSEVINTYKEKNFASYLNNLRIDYGLKRLVMDKRFRSYKLSVIADELGYNNEQAFSLAFKKKTGTTLSTYIKEIDNI